MGQRNVQTSETMINIKHLMWVRNRWRKIQKKKKAKKSGNRRQQKGDSMRKMEDIQKGEE